MVIKRIGLADGTEQDLVNEFPYSVFQDGSRYEKAYINMSSEQKADENNHDHVATLVEFDDPSEAIYYHRLAKSSYSKYIKWMYLIDFDQDPVVVLVDEIEGFYDEWCEREYDYFQNSTNRNEARDIFNKFITILSGVVEGLIFLFKKGKYHGNLTDGIKVDDDLNVTFYNMRRNGHGDENFEDGIAEDIKDVHEMISIWLSREDEFVELRLLRRYQEKLENKALMTNKNYIWGIDDPIFWNRLGKYDFMVVLFYFMHFQRPFLPKSFENCFTFDWQSLVPEEENDPLRKTYSRMHPSEEGPRYTKNFHLVYFWEKALYKYNEYSSKPEGEYCALSPEEVHAKMEETFDVTRVCFSAIQCYLLQENMSDEDVPIKAQLKAEVGDKLWRR